MKTQIGKDINKASQILKSGNIVAIPTETVYGLASNALDPIAVEKIFLAKNRPFFNPLIIHTDSIEKISNFVLEIPEKAKIILENLSPGPITVVLKKANNIPDIVTGGHDSVAIRIPNHPLTLELLSQLDFPLAAPSANPFGFISPTKAEHVYEQLNGKLEYILDGGKCTVGVESTIISFTEETPLVLRFGGISIEKIESLIGKVNINTSSDKPIVPGQLKSHYAPTHKLVFGNIDELLKNYSDYSKVGLLSFDKYYSEVPKENQILLSETSNIDEAAQNLFDSLRKLDKINLDIILAQVFPDVEIGKAINDRLTRASS